MDIEYICQNDNIRLSEELKAHATRKFYKRLRFLNTRFYVNGILTETYKEIRKGDKITFSYTEETEPEWPLYESHLDIAYEDMWYLIVRKRKGLLSIPTKSEPRSIYQEVLYYLKEKGEPLTISILNRLDKETGGLMVIAKNRLAANALEPTHEKMERRYYCLTHGIWELKEGVMDTFLSKDEESGKRYVSESGKRAISHYKVIREDGDVSLVEFILQTGRTHQIRLHAAYMGHPILGDKLYGMEDDEKYMQLQSAYVSFMHPYRNMKIEVKDEFVYEK